MPECQGKMLIKENGKTLSKTLLSNRKLIYLPKQNLNHMKNEILFKALQEKGFDGSENSLVKKIREDYSVVTDFNEDESITVVNFYKDSDDEFDYGKRFVLFQGKCKDVKKYAELINILNVEEQAKVSILKSLDVFCACNCGCKSKK
jgi:hypothetical protein